MKKILFIALSLSLAIHTLFTSPAQAAEVTMRMTESGFEPRELTVNQGDTVIFKNEDTRMRWPASNLHPTHEIYREFDPLQGIEPQNSWSFTFGKAGTWRMHDHIYPQFSGVITVTGDSSATDQQDSSPGFWARLWQGIKNIWHAIINWGQDPKDTKDDGILDTAIKEGDKEIFSNDTALKSHLVKYGAQKTITSLRLMENEFGSCHQPAHRAGRIGYKVFGEKAFIEYSAECQSGYYHGVMEGYFEEYEGNNLTESLGTLCKGGLNSFFEHQCVHGIGHGIMAWTNYELIDALKVCDDLPRRQDSCWTGVFMENLVAKPLVNGEVPNQDIGNTDIHYTKYLNEDAQYPCNAVADTYKGSCYFLQTSRMLQIFGADFAKIAEACSAAPTIYQHSCFGSMGRDVGGSFPKDMAREIKECSWVENPGLRIECLNGAVQNSFWDPSGQDLALEFCRLLTDEPEKSACYNTIFSRAPEVIFDRAGLEGFCAKAETAYQAQCRRYIP